MANSAMLAALGLGGAPRRGPQDVMPEDAPDQPTPPSAPPKKPAPPIPRDAATDKLLLDTPTTRLIQSLGPLQDALDSAQKNASANPTNVGMQGAAKLAQDALFNTMDEVTKRGLNLDGTRATPQQTADNQANLNARYAEIAITRDHYERSDATDATRAQTEQKNADTSSRLADIDKQKADDAAKNDKVTAVLDLLKQQVAAGDLTAREAQAKATAAFNAADVQRSLYNDLGKYSLPAGSEYYPNLGPGGSVANMAAAMGMPFAPVGTGGTTMVSPTAITAPITAAANGANAGAQVTAATQNAARILAGMGIQSGVGA